jgi:hypothetical protein
VSSPEEGSSEALQQAVFAFKVDRITAEISTALSERSIPSILVKGPAIATWLYSGEAPRLYGDTDLFLRKSDWEKAFKLMEGLGFEDDLGPLDHPRMESGEGFPWFRNADGAAVDLHYTLFGIGVPPEDVWIALSETAVGENVGGIEITMPSRPARLVHIALHAIQHEGGAWEKPMKDLELAIAKVPVETWTEARELAERLNAAETFAAGLRLTPAGRELATTIGATQAPTVQTALRLENVPLSEGFQELREAPGIRSKLALVFRELFPTREFMRWWSPMASRGPAGMFLAYCWRPVWLVYRSVPGFIAWRKATRQSR